MNYKLPQSAAVYAIHNIVTGEEYVGGSTNVAQRWYVHRYNLTRGISGHTKLQQAWNQYGEENFRVLILEMVDNPSTIIEREQHYLDTIKPAYNTRLSADNSIAIPLSPESRAIVTAKITGMPKPEGFGEAVGNRRRGVKASPETIEKMRKAKANISDETRAKMSAAKKGKAQVAATQAAAAKNRGKPRDPAVIERIREGQRKRWADKKEAILAEVKRGEDGRFAEK